MLISVFDILYFQLSKMRTAFIVLALATVCLAAAIDKTSEVDAVIPVAVTYESEDSVSDVAADTTLSRSKRAPLLFAKLKLLKLGLLGLGAVKVAKVAKVALVGAGIAGVASLAARSGSGGNGGGSYTSSTNFNSQSSYGPSDTTVVQETVVSEPAPYPAAVPHETYGPPQTFTAHKDVVISYNAGG